MQMCFFLGFFLQRLFPTLDKEQREYVDSRSAIVCSCPQASVLWFLWHYFIFCHLWDVFSTV